MRIRSTKPEFWRSKTIADALDWSDRYVLKGLEAYVDDNGVGKDDIELIATEVFPRDTLRSPQETVVRLSEAISRIHSAGLIARYEVDGEKLLYIDRWSQIQRINRPSSGRFPRPDGTMEFSQPVNRESYVRAQDPAVSPHCAFSAGTGEQRNRGTEEKERPPERTEQQSATRKSTDGAALARQRFAELPTRTAAAHQIAQAFSNSLSTPLEHRMLAEVGDVIDRCIGSGITPSAIANGLKAWTASDSWSPTQIPKFVHKANNGHAKHAQKALDWRDAAEALIAELETAP